VWLDGTGKDFQSLPNWPVVTIYNCGLYPLDVLTVMRANVEVATVITKLDRITLYSIANGVVSEKDYKFTDFPTFDTMAAAMCADGWTANVLGVYGPWASAYTRPNQSCPADAPEFYGIQIVGQTFPVRLKAQTTHIIERVGMADLGFKRTLWQGGLERIGPAAFPEGRSNIFVHYRAGYVCPIDDAGGTSVSNAADVNLPSELTLVANILTKAMLDASLQDMGAVQSENLGDYSYTLAEGGRGIGAKVIAENSALLLKHKRLL
jgi:hypothetical protein